MAVCKAGRLQPAGAWEVQGPGSELFGLPAQSSQQQGLRPPGSSSSRQEQSTPLAGGPRASVLDAWRPGPTCSLRPI